MHMRAVGVKWHLLRTVPVRWNIRIVSMWMMLVTTEGIVARCGVTRLLGTSSKHASDPLSNFDESWSHLFPCVLHSDVFYSLLIVYYLFYCGSPHQHNRHTRTDCSSRRSKACRR